MSTSSSSSSSAAGAAAGAGAAAAAAPARGITALLKKEGDALEETKARITVFKQVEKSVDQLSNNLSSAKSTDKDALMQAFKESVEERLEEQEQERGEEELTPLEKRRLTLRRQRAEKRELQRVQNLKAAAWETAVRRYLVGGFGSTRSLFESLSDSDVDLVLGGKRRKLDDEEIGKELGKDAGDVSTIFDKAGEEAVKKAGEKVNA